MKKILVLTIAAAIILSMLAGCGGPGNNNGTAGVSKTDARTQAKAEDKPVTITYWGYPSIKGINGDGNGEYEDWYMARGEEFKKTNPNVDLKVEIMPFAEGRQKISIAIASGTTPDLTYTINSWGGVSNYAKVGVIEPIDPYLTQDDWNDFSTAIQGAMKYKDEAYMWPWLKLVSGLMVNMDLVKQRNAENLIPLDKEMRDWTFDEFIAAAKALTFDSDGDGKIDTFGFDFGGVNPPFYAYLTITGFGGRILDPTFVNIALDSEETRKGLQMVSDLLNVHKVTPAGTASMDSDTSGQMFLQQQIAMEYDEGGVIEEINKLDKPFKVEFVAPPHAEGVPISAWNNVGGFVVFKQDDDAKKVKVMEFARFLSSAENEKILSQIGCFPARKSAGNIYPAEDSTHSYLTKLSEYGNSEFSRGYGLLSNDDWSAEIQALLLKSKTPQQVIDTLKGKISESLDK